MKEFENEKTNNLFYEGYLGFQDRLSSPRDHYFADLYGSYYLMYKSLPFVEEFLTSIKLMRWAFHMFLPI